MAIGMLCAVNTRRAADLERRRKPVQRGTRVPGVGLDEPRVIVPVAHVRHRHIAQPGFHSRTPRTDDVLPVLRAARIASVRRTHEADRAPDAVLRHRLERVGQERMPVPHAEVDRHVQPAGGQVCFQSFNLAAGDGGKR